MEKRDSLKGIELRQLAVLTKARMMDMEGERRMTSWEMILWHHLVKKYPRKSFMFFCKLDMNIRRKCGMAKLMLLNRKDTFLGREK